MATLPTLYVDNEAMEGETVSDEMREEQMTDDELVAVLQQHEAQAIGYQPGGDDDISTQQQRAIDYYYRIMDDVPAAQGSSSVVDGTVQTVIDNALAALLKPFVSSDETVMFAPRGPEDVQVAEQATEYANYVFNCDNPGFNIFYSWFKDALLTKLGIIKVWWEEDRQIVIDEEIPLDGVNDDIIRAMPNYLGEEGGVAAFGRIEDNGKVKIENVPPEEFRISPLSRSVATAIYCAHVPTNVTRSDLIEMGFDHELVEDLSGTIETVYDNTVRQARYNDESMADDSLAAPHKSQDRIPVRDEYIRIDYDGDGVAELRRVVRVDDVVLLNEEVEAVPFAALCPIPMPHKVYGLSLADLVIELQKISTVLWRQMLDNLYKSNNPRPVVGEGARLSDGSTEQSLGDSAAGAAVELRDINQFRFDAVPYTAAASMPMLDAVANMTEERTGIGKAGQGLDTNALRKSGQMTATEMAMIQGGKNARVEMIARIFAETGVKDLFKTINRLLVQHQPKARMIRLRNQWVEVDPSSWPEMDVEISVGLGIGEKSEQIAQAQAVLESMRELAQSPFAHLIDDEKVYNALKRQFNAAGIKNVDDFLNEPGQQQEPEGPSPEEQAMQADMMMQQAKLQGEQQLAAAKLEMQREEAALKMELDRQKAEFEAQMAEQKLAAEMALAERKMEIEAQLNAKKMEAANLPDNRPGGDLDK